MHGKEFVVDLIRTYFLVVTLINVVMLVLGTHFIPGAEFGYEAFKAPLLYGAAGMLPNIVMYSRRELTMKELMIRRVAQVLLIEIVVLFVALYGQDGFLKDPTIILSLSVCILIIYVISCLIDWIQNTVSARKMTAELMKFQKSAIE